MALFVPVMEKMTILVYVACICWLTLVALLFLIQLWEGQSVHSSVAEFDWLASSSSEHPFLLHPLVTTATIRAMTSTLMVALRISS